jgi:hypothetical protein
MKKYTYLLLAAGMLMFTTSCKKSYTCACFNPWTQSTVNETIKDTKKKAKAACDKLDDNAEMGGYTSCEFKN